MYISMSQIVFDALKPRNSPPVAERYTPRSRRTPK